MSRNSLDISRYTLPAPARYNHSAALYNHFQGEKMNHSNIDFDSFMQSREGIFPRRPDPLPHFFLCGAVDRPDFKLAFCGVQSCRNKSGLEKFRNRFLPCKGPSQHFAPDLEPTSC